MPSLAPAADRRHTGPGFARVLLLILLAAFLLRLALIFWFDTWRMPPEQDHWNFGLETGRIARSLSEGNGFSSPFQQPSGPTAWLAPGYPWLVSLLFRIFGIYSPASALAILILNSLLSALTCIVVYRLGRDFYDGNVALIAAALYALAPGSIWSAIGGIWDVNASTLLMGMVLWLLRELDLRPESMLALQAAACAGVLALFNPSCLSVYAVGLVWIALRRHRQFPALWPVFGVLIAIPAAISMPWLIRNELVLGRFVLKSNFGTELRIGNNPTAINSAAGDAMLLHPANREFARYKQLGEIAYTSECGRQAIAFIRANPATFLTLVVRRIAVFWTGVSGNNWKSTLKTRMDLSLAKRLALVGWTALALFGLAAGFRPGEHMLLLLPLLVYPWVFYITHVTVRYRSPLEPFLAVLAAHGLLWVWRRGSLVQHGHFAQEKACSPQ